MTGSFKEAYGTLQKHAATLREQKEPNIDDLLRVVTESVSAYKVCQERIDAVEKALQAGRALRYFDANWPACAPNSCLACARAATALLKTSGCSVDVTTG